MRRKKTDIRADRYPEFWDELSLKVKKLTGGRCCYPGCKAAYYKGDKIETHHIITGIKLDSGLWVPVEAYVPGTMVVPLCERHHQDRSDPECAHHKKNWFAGTEKNRFRDARNTPEYHLTLTKGWYQKILPEYRKQ